MTERPLFFYANGVLVFSSSTPNCCDRFSFSTNINTANNTPLIVGGGMNAWGGNNPFSGAFDDLRIYDRELSFAEVAALAVPTSTTTPSITPSSTPDPSCLPSAYTAYPYADLSGAVLSVTLGSPSEKDCQLACCGAAECTGYSWAGMLPNLACFLFANVTGVTPNLLFTSGVSLQVPLSLPATASPTPSIATPNAPGSVAVQYVKFSREGYNYIGMQEFQLIDSHGVNVMLEGGVATSNVMWFGQPDRTVDGKFTYANNSCDMLVYAMPNPSILFDLGGEHMSLATLKLYPNYNLIVSGSPSESPGDTITFMDSLMNVVFVYYLPTAYRGASHMPYVVDLTALFASPVTSPSASAAPTRSLAASASVSPSVAPTVGFRRSPTGTAQGTQLSSLSPSPTLPDRWWLSICPCSQVLCGRCLSGCSVDYCPPGTPRLPGWTGSESRNLCSENDLVIDPYYACGLSLTHPIDWHSELAITLTPLPTPTSLTTPYCSATL